MTVSPERDDSSQSGRARIGKSKMGVLAVVALVAIYSVSAPKLNERFGWQLPAIKTDRDGNVRMADSTPPANVTSSAKSDAEKKVLQPRSTTNEAAPTSPQSTKTGPTGPGPLSSRMQPVERSSATPTSKPLSSVEENPLVAESGELLYGILREVSRDRYLSPAGLMYTPGSAEGHRLEHLRRHTEDDVGRPGSHGVFDGDMAGALATIDRAYERALKKQKTTVTEEDGRKIYTVDMGGRIGFIGGQTGKQKRNPIARRVRMVIEGNRVITAYPM